MADSDSEQARAAPPQPATTDTRPAEIPRLVLGPRAAPPQPATTDTIDAGGWLPPDGERAAPPQPATTDTHLHYPDDRFHRAGRAAAARND